MSDETQYDNMSKKELIVALSRANTSKKKLPSLFFINKKGEPQLLGGLSETKRMLETQYPDVLKALLGDDKKTNYEFNDLLVPALKKGLNL